MQSGTSIWRRMNNHGYCLSTALFISQSDTTSSSSKFIYVNQRVIFKATVCNEIGKFSLLYYLFFFLFVI